MLQWRNSDLDFSSIGALQASLAEMPSEQGLTRAPVAEDILVLEHAARDADIRAMADKGVVATLLPLTAFALKESYARGREMIDAGCAVALATDLNPGSCFSGSIPLTFALACIYMKMSIEEAITALTLNGAAALNRADSIVVSRWARKETS